MNELVRCQWTRPFANGLGTSYKLTMLAPLLEQSYLSHMTDLHALASAITLIMLPASLRWQSHWLLVRDFPLIASFLASVSIVTPLFVFAALICLHST